MRSRVETSWRFVSSTRGIAVAHLRRESWPRILAA
jgi:hypothetical protein